MQKKNRLNNALSVAYSNLKHNARRRAAERGVAFEQFFQLTREQFQRFAEMTNYMDKRGRSHKGYHIDRIDATRGYAVDNIRCIPAVENCRKGATTDKFYLHNGQYEPLPF